MKKTYVFLCCILLCFITNVTVNAETINSPRLERRKKVFFQSKEFEALPMEKKYDLTKKMADEGDEQAAAIIRVINKRVEFARSEAEKGVPEAQMFLGDAYLKGNFGLPVDSKEGFNWMKKASDKNLVCSHANVALLYTNGLGTERDYDKAFEYYKKAAETGCDNSFFNMGVATFYGDGVERNLDKALEYMLEAEKRGHPGAEAFVEDIEKTLATYKAYVDNDENRKKREMGRVKQLAEIGYVDMQYEAGFGLLPFTIMHQEFYDESKMWLEKAANKGHVKAKEILADMNNDTGDRAYLKHYFGTEVNLKGIASDPLPNF